MRWIEHERPTARIFHDDALHAPRNRVSWALLAFACGAANACGLLTCGILVTHVSGAFTMVGAHGAQSRWRALLDVGAVPVGFVLGAMFSAWLIDRRAHQGKAPQHALALATSAALLLGVAAIDLLGVASSLDSPLGAFADFVEVLPLCIAAGIINATVSTATGGVVRVTHLTGTLTDLGVGLVRWIHPARDKQRREADLAGTRLRALLTASFVGGAALGSALELDRAALGFCAAAVCVLVATAVSFAPSAVAVPATRDSVSPA